MPLAGIAKNIPPSNYITLNDGGKSNVKDYQATRVSAYSFRSNKYKRTSSKMSNRSYADLNGHENSAFFESGGFSMAAGDDNSHGDSILFGDVDESLA